MQADLGLNQKRVDLQKTQEEAEAKQKIALASIKTEELNQQRMDIARSLEEDYHV